MGDRIGVLRADVSTENRGAVTSSNLPVSIQPRFDCDQLALIFGTCILDPVFVLDCESECLVAVNQALLDLVDYTIEELEEQEITFGSLVHGDDRAVFRTWIEDGGADNGKRIQIRLRGKESEAPEPRIEGQPKEPEPIGVEVALKRIRWQRREYQLGFLKLNGNRHRREAKLRREVEKQKQRAVQAVSSSVRMYALNEKIKSTLVLMTNLLHAEDERALFQEATRILTNDEGVNFKTATILVLEDGKLATVLTTDEGEEKQVYSLSEDNKYSRMVEDGLLGQIDVDHTQKELVFPLQSRGRLVGMVEVTQHAGEKKLFVFDDHQRIREWQRDMLRQIGDIIALLLDNLRLNRELKRQSIVDSLTGAGNRNFFMQRLRSEVQRAHRYGRPMSLIFLDVDHFKEINDGYGHLQGDQVLRDLGAVFRSNLRKVDVLGRYGGDEFVLLLPETTKEMAEETAEKLIRSVRAHHFLNLDAPDQSVNVSISVGLATLTPGQDEERFLQAADAALYVAKKHGRDRVATTSEAEAASPQLAEANAELAD